MSKVTRNLWSRLVPEHDPALENASRPRPGRFPRSRVIAGGTLALAVGGTALALGLTGTGGTPAAAGGGRVVTDAFTVTQRSGSVLVQINQEESINAANARLKAMTNEEVVLRMASGPAPVSGPVACTPGVAGRQGPAVKVLLGSDGTQVITPGTTAGNTGVGTWHVTACHVYPAADLGTGGTGAAG
jgi:hypothetical protein